MDECVTISDDEDVELVDYIVNIEPIIIDLTRVRNRKCDEYNITRQPVPSPQPQQPPQSPQPTQPTEPQEPPRTPQSQKPQQPQPCQPAQQTYPTESNESNEPSESTEPTEATEATEPTEEPEPPRPPEIQTKRAVVDDREIMFSQKELGNEKYRNNLFTDAIKVYRRANELAVQLNDMDTSAKLHFNLAMTYYKLGSYNQSADECANAVRIDDNYMKAHLKRAEIYLRLQKFDEAVICYEHICELDKENRDYQTMLFRAKEAAKRVRRLDSYQILGFNNAFVSHDALKKAYRRLALSHHPDRHSGSDLVTRKIHEKKFKDATEALKHVERLMGYNR